MREIKFRAWDKLREEYLSGGQVILAIQSGKNPKIVHYLDILKHPDSYKDRFILEQYTPIKSICESDKVYIAGVGICTITFDGLIFEAVTEKGDILELRDCLEDIENVVGNIHEKQ